jgi:hypothetical protein
MLFLNDTISLQHSKIVSKIFSQHARDSVVSYVNLFGNLYYGHLHPTIFLTRYQCIKSDFLTRLQTTQDEVARKLCMLEIAQRESWRWPGMITELDQGLFWRTGNGRIIATGLVHDDPWAKLPVLILQSKKTAADAYLSDGVKVTTDEELHQALGLKYQVGVEYYHPEVEFQAELIEDIGYPKLMLKYVGSKESESDYSMLGQSKLQEFNKWHQRYGVNPTLHVYSDDIDLVVSTTWNIVHMGPMPDRHTMFLPGHLERVMLNHNPQHDHTLYVAGKRRVFVDDLLPWMDTQHTTFVDKDWNFAVFRKDSNYKIKMISITQDTDK